MTVPRRQMLAVTEPDVVADAERPGLARRRWSPRSSRRRTRWPSDRPGSRDRRAPAGCKKWRDRVDRAEGRLDMPVHEGASEATTKVSVPPYFGSPLLCLAWASALVETAAAATAERDFPQFSRAFPLVPPFGSLGFECRVSRRPRRQAAIAAAVASGPRDLAGAAGLRAHFGGHPRRPVGLVQATQWPGLTLCEGGNLRLSPPTASERGWKDASGRRVGARTAARVCVRALVDRSGIGTASGAAPACRGGAGSLNSSSVSASSTMWPRYMTATANGEDARRSGRG